MSADSPPLARRCLAEFIGTAFLLAAIVGSGIMAARLAGGSTGLALLCNALATGAALAALILAFGPVSGAHFNPVVSVAFALGGETPPREAAAYIAAQIAGAIVGVLAAHLMFDLSLLQISTTARTGAGQWFAEFVATFGLLAIIFGCAAREASAAPFAIGAYIVAAYWFTASTSFANPAVALARTLTDSFAGIAPTDAPAFILAQLAGMAVAVLLRPILWPAGNSMRRI